MRRHRYTPYDVNLGTADIGHFTLEFSVETAPNQPHTRVCVTMPRWWGSVLMCKIMEVVRNEEKAVTALRREIKEEANR